MYVLSKLESDFLVTLKLLLFTFENEGSGVFKLLEIEDFSLPNELGSSSSSFRNRNLQKLVFKVGTLVKFKSLFDEKWAKRKY